MELLEQQYFTEQYIILTRIEQRLKGTVVNRPIKGLKDIIAN